MVVQLSDNEPCAKAICVQNEYSGDLFTSFEKDKRFEVKKAFHLFTENKMYKTSGCFKEN